MGIRFMSSLCVISGLVGCVDVADEAPADEVESSTESSTSQAICFAPATPPAADIGWGLAPGEDKTFTDVTYGTAQCAHITFAFGPATEVSGTLADPLTTKATCESTSVTGRFYVRSGSTWTFITTKSATGVWVPYAGCIEPSIRYEVPASGPDHGQLAYAEMRLYMYASRTTCTTGTPQICGTSYGMPVESTGGRHEHF